jgi:hypothetical protein
MIKKNYTKPHKITLIGWVDSTMDQSLTRKNIMLRFKGIRIWPFNPKATNAKIGLHIIYTLQNQVKEEEGSK